VKRILILGAAGVVALVAGIAIAMAATGGGSATVSVKQIGTSGRVLVDAKGRALYFNDQERGGRVLCAAGCVSFWKPLTVTGTPRAGSVPGKLGVATRPGGARQVTYRGKRLYSFTLDRPGRVTGDGFKDAFGGRTFTWHVAHPAGAAAATTTTTSTGGGGYPGYP
jgi:predicted lipoprotein with Yx(FWY)xxD motif